MATPGIRFRCPHCQKRLRAAPRHAGAEIACPRCGRQIAVPEPSGERTSHEFSVLSRAAESEEQQYFRAATTRRFDDPEADLTPMVDVVFQLLIFFMVTAAFIRQKSLEIPPPSPADEVTQSRSVREFEEDQDYVVVRIEKDDTLWVDENEAPSEQELLAQLREARTARGAAAASKLLVVASPECRHEMVVLALDAGAAVGMQQVSLATADDEY